MKWGGFIPFSLSDFPGKVAAIAFARGCNFNCAYCHNRQLIDCGSLGGEGENDWTSTRILSHLKRRKHQLDGLVISGGEPTCQPDLLSFVEAVKRLGLAVKLDTNGSKPQVLAELIDRNLLDYIAMDIKAPLHKYAEVTSTRVSVDSIDKSIRLIGGSSLPSEFRTTAVAPMLNESDLLEIANLVQSKRPLYLQTFCASTFSAAETLHTMPELSRISFTLKERFTNVHLR